MPSSKGKNRVDDWASSKDEDEEIQDGVLLIQGKDEEEDEMMKSKGKGKEKKGLRIDKRPKYLCFLTWKSLTQACIISTRACITRVITIVTCYSVHDQMLQYGSYSITIQNSIELHGHVVLWLFLESYTDRYTPMTRSCTLLTNFWVFPESYTGRFTVTCLCNSQSMIWVFIEFYGCYSTLP